MISKALQSLDAWLAQAEEVLVEQTTYLQFQHGPDVHLSEAESSGHFGAARSPFPEPRPIRRKESWMPVPAPQHLNNHHRDTLLQIFQHPTSHNIEWPAVLSLLEAVGTVEQQQNGRYVVSVGTETEVLNSPKHKDIDVQLVVDLRRMLTNTGYGAVAEELGAKGHEV